MSNTRNRFHPTMSGEQIDQLPGTEIKSKRTRFGKVFALGANRFQAVTYTDPVHRFNKQTREWDELDNRFCATPRMEAARQQGLVSADQGEVLLECKTGSMDVACAMSGEMPFINLTDQQGRQLAWGVKAAMAVLPEASAASDAPARNVRAMRERVLDHLHGEVTYKGVFTGVDLRCKLDRGFKDEFVFAEKESVRPVTFLLESEGRRMELDGQNVLTVLDEQGEAVFRLQAPFMLDANEQRGAVAVQLEAREDGMYAMTCIPEEEFVESAAFPVVLDPAIESVRGESGIVDTYVKEGSTSLYNTSDQVWICNNTTYGHCCGLMRVVDLPRIDANHFITGAFLNLKNYNAPSAETALMCSEITGDWAVDEVTYATMPEVNPLYQDYCKFPKSQYTWRQMDVTTLARKWYLGNNLGVALLPSPVSPNTIRIQSSDGSAKPYFTVNYASLAGLESYLTYDGQSAGLAGSGAVSLVNGNLIFTHGDTAMDGSRMPVSVAHYYNSCNADADEFGLGYGWRTSVHQTLHKEYINEEVVYVYTDGDGTEHWFEPDEDDSTQYVDLSGLSLTLKVGDDGRITITSKGDGRMVFPAIAAVPTADAPATGKVLIESIHDPLNNQITVTARTDEPLYVDHVTDGAGRITSFIYAVQADESLMCTAIRTPWQTDTACTRFAYTDGCLTAISHEDNRVSTYHYIARNGYSLLAQAQGADGLAVCYTYSNTGAVYGLPHCITCAETGEAAILSTDESVKAAALYAARTSYNYGNHLTLVTDNISGKTLRYHFNDNGNQVSVDDELGHAVYTRYDQTDDNAGAPINHATLRSRMQRVVKNLLMDSSFEWNSSLWEKSSTGTFIRLQDDNQWGMISRRIEVNENSAYIRQPVTLIPGQSYTLSGYLKSQVTAFFRIAYTVNGTTCTVDSDAVPPSATAASEGYTRLAVSFTLPADADAQVYCSAECSGGTGYTWIDCMQLEEGLTCNHYNMLQNTDFVLKESDGTTPAEWEKGSASSGYVSCYSLADAEGEDADAPEFLKNSDAVRLLGRYDRTITLSQNVRCSGVAGDRFSLGGWCKSLAKKEDIDNYTYCRINAAFSASDPSSSSVTTTLGGAVYFNAGEEGWQFGCADVVAPCRYNYIRVTMQMNRQMNHADFTNLFLYPESFGTDYVYDAKGNRTSARQLYGGVSEAEYDDCNNLIQHTAPGHTKSSTFSYGETEAEQKQHLLREACSPLGTESAFTYDDFGNAVRADVSGAVGDLTAITRSATEYQHSGNYVHKQTDARGKTVTTEVDADKGVTTSVADPKGQTVEYEHDALRRVVKVRTVDGSREFRNEYAYDPERGLLTTVKHNVDDNAENDVVYSFEYDKLGRRTKVSVGETTLSTNVYQNDPAEDHYGTLSEMQYGNGTAVKNEYDDFNRVTGVVYGAKSENAEAATFEDNPRYEYAYNANGQVAYVRNNLLGQIAQSEYDLSNRPCRVTTHKFTEDEAGNLTSLEHVYTGEVAYDDTFGRLSEFNEKVGADREEFATTFGYDDENRPTAQTYGDHGASTLAYDGLGRVAQATVTAGDGTANTTTYTYVAGAELEDVTDKTSTTGLVASIAQTGGNFTYTYDDNGNIVSVVQDGVTTAYTYDALGQLVQVDDGQENCTWAYTYDQGGNILSKKKYALGVTSGTPVESKVFTYGNANWKDQLTAIDGVAISYDAIGNPLSDGTWTYTWENGRQLARMQSVDTDASFVYNENGLRVQKTVNGVVTNYTLHGKNVVHMIQGNDELHFFYDAQNKPAIVVYNGVPYSYVKNLQGDIVALLDSTGAVVVAYKYDAWGRPISKTGGLADTLGTVQPFRYRGYVYDEETELYYLRSRYYSHIWHRFLNVDTEFSLNRYSYTNNSVVKTSDSDGFSDEDSTLNDLHQYAAYHFIAINPLQTINRSYKKQTVIHWIIMDVESTEQFIIADYFGRSAYDEQVKTIVADATSDLLLEFSTKLIGDAAEQFATPFSFLSMVKDISSSIQDDKENKMFGDAYYAAKEAQTGVVVKATITYSHVYKWNQGSLCERWHHYKGVSYEYYELNDFLSQE